jgi:hypothetical protein
MKALITIVLLFASAVCHAQAIVDTVYRVELTASVCPSFNSFRNASVPGTDHKSSFGFGTFLRVMWHPGRLLSLGVLTGYMLIDREEIAFDPSLISQPGTTPRYSARLTAIPLQAAISMRRRDVEVGVGIGPYLMLSTIEGGNLAASNSSRLELGLTYYGSYSFALNDHITIAPEVRVLYLRYRGILSLMPSCSFRIDALRY